MSVHKETIGKYTIKIHTDDNPESPREWDNVGTMVCFHRRHNLGDKHDYKSPSGFFIDLMRECPPEGLIQIVYALDAPNEFLSLNKIDDLEDFAKCSTDELRDYLEPEIGSSDRKLHETIAHEYPGVVLPLYLYDHSGITMNTSGFSCPWDSGQVGWIYVSYEKALKEYGDFDKYANERECIEKHLKGEVKVYDDYLTGNVYGYTVLDEDDYIIDSCWGFYPDADNPTGYAYCLSEAKSFVEYRISKDTEEASLDTQFLSAPLGAD